MNNNVYDILESCLQELDHGTDVNDIIARYPNFARDLRPILSASLQAKNMTAPSREAVVRGRARLMQHVAVLREEKSAPRTKRVIPLFRRLAFSLALVFVLVISGSGLVNASASALPGQNLYPVKRGWEGVRLFLTFNHEKRNSLEQEIEEERVYEVNELLSDEERLLVDFSGFFTSANGKTYVSDVQVLFPADAQLPPDGAALRITGWTTEKGYVEIISFEVLPDGSVIPGGSSVQETLPFPTGEGENENATEQPAGGEEQETIENEGAPTQENIGVATPSETQKHNEENRNENEGETESREEVVIEGK